MMLIAVDELARDLAGMKASEEFLSRYRAAVIGHHLEYRFDRLDNGLVVPIKNALVLTLRNQYLLGQVRKLVLEIRLPIDTQWLRTGVGISDDLHVVVVDLGCKQGLELNLNFELFEFSNLHSTLNDASREQCRKKSVP